MILYPILLILIIRRLYSLQTTSLRGRNPNQSTLTRRHKVQYRLTKSYNLSLFIILFVDLNSFVLRAILAWDYVNEIFSIMSFELIFWCYVIIVLRNKWRLLRLYRKLVSFWWQSNMAHVVIIYRRNLWMRGRGDMNK